MRIVYLSNSTIPSQDANSVHVMKMCHALAQCGHSVHLVAKEGRHDSRRDDYALYGVQKRFPLVQHNLRGLGSLARIIYPFLTRRDIRSLKPDLVYTRHRLSALFALSFRIPFVLESHTAPGSTARQMEARLFACSHFRRLVVISHALKEEYLRLHPRLSADMIAVAPDAADVPPPAETLSPPQLPSAASGCPLRIGYIGHLYPGKGMELIVRVAPLMEGAEFHIIGGKPSDLSRWRESTSALPNVILHGHVPAAETDAWRQAMDVLIAPYQSTVRVAEGKQDVSRWMSPLKLFEYMAAAKPIVASDLPVIREVLQDNVTALLAPPDSPELWIDAFNRLRDSSERQRLGAAGHRRFLERHTWKQRAQMVLDAAVEPPAAVYVHEKSQLSV